MKKNLDEKRIYLGRVLHWIIDDVDGETRGVTEAPDYKRTMTLMFEISQMYGLDPLSLSRWRGWQKFCEDYKTSGK